METQGPVAPIPSSPKRVGNIIRTPSPEAKHAFKLNSLKESIIKELEKCNCQYELTPDGQLFKSLNVGNNCYIPYQLRDGAPIENHYLPILMSCIIPIQINMIKYNYAVLNQTFNPITHVVVVKGYSASHGEVETREIIQETIEIIQDFIPNAPVIPFESIGIVQDKDSRKLSDIMPNIPEAEAEDTSRDQANMEKTIDELRSVESPHLLSKKSKIEEPQLQPQPQYNHETVCVTRPYPLLLLNSAPCGYKFTGNYEIMQQIQNWYDNNRDYHQSHLKILFYINPLKIGVLIATIEAIEAVTRLVIDADPITIMNRVKENIVQYDEANNLWSIVMQHPNPHIDIPARFNETFLRGITMEKAIKACEFIKPHLGLQNIYTESTPNKYKRFFQGIVVDIDINGYIAKLLRTAEKIVFLLSNPDALMREKYGPGSSYNQKYLAYSLSSLIPGNPDICLYVYVYKFEQVDAAGIGIGEPTINTITPIIKITLMRQFINPGVVDRYPVKLSVLCDIAWYICRSFNKILYNVYKKVLPYHPIIMERVNNPFLSFFVGSCSGYSRRVQSREGVRDMSIPNAEVDDVGVEQDFCRESLCNPIMRRQTTEQELSKVESRTRKRRQPNKRGGTRKNRKRKTRKHRKSMKSNRRRSSLRRRHRSRSRKHSFNSRGNIHCN